jgi:glycosyltransferase involved in cell wall biosynthesis
VSEQAVSRMVPAVSIGVPVYNGAAALHVMLESLLQQTFMDFEIIVSDNASTDETADICAKFMAREPRIRYIRQATNIGPERNFKFVLEQARGHYFMWSAVDDVRSPEFLEENVNFLKTHPDYVASTCPNRLQGREVVSFAIEGSIVERFHAFLDHCWASHGIFYALIRTEVLRDCNAVGQSFFGVDWAVDLFLASRGQIHRTAKGMMVSGVSGISSQANVWRRYRTHWVSWLFPFYRVSLYALEVSSSVGSVPRAALLWRLLKLNGWSAYSQLHAECHPFYAARIKPWLRPSRSRKAER